MAGAAHPALNEQAGWAARRKRTSAGGGTDQARTSRAARDRRPAVGDTGHGSGRRRRCSGCGSRYYSAHDRSGGHDASARQRHRPRQGAGECALSGPWAAARAPVCNGQGPRSPSASLTAHRPHHSWAARLFRSPSARAIASAVMSSLVVVRNRSVVDDADEHQEPKQDDEDRNRPAFGHAVSSRYPSPSRRHVVR
jgi:hypothetical protein